MFHYSKNQITEIKSKTSRLETLILLGLHQFHYKKVMLKLFIHKKQIGKNDMYLVNLTIKKIGKDMDEPLVSFF
jgi:hypothetical protein